MSEEMVLYKGATARVALTPRNKKKKPVEARNITWEVENETLLSIEVNPVDAKLCSLKAKDVIGRTKVTAYFEFQVKEARWKRAKYVFLVTVQPEKGHVSLVVGDPISEPTDPSPEGDPSESPSPTQDDLPVVEIPETPGTSTTG